MNPPSYKHMNPVPHGDTVVISIWESMLRDAPTCYALRDEIISAIDSSGAKNVILDLSSVEFIGSIGFLAFLGARRQVPSGRVILCEVSDNIRDMFRLCALTSPDPAKSAPFEEADSLESALARCSS